MVMLSVVLALYPTFLFCVFFLNCNWRQATKILVISQWFLSCLGVTKKTQLFNIMKLLLCLKRWNSPAVKVSFLSWTLFVCGDGTPAGGVVWQSFIEPNWSEISPYVLNKTLCRNMEEWKRWSGVDIRACLLHVYEWIRSVCSWVAQDRMFLLFFIILIHNFSLSGLLLLSTNAVGTLLF